MKSHHSSSSSLRSTDSNNSTHPVTPAMAAKQEECVRLLSLVQKVAARGEINELQNKNKDLVDEMHKLRQQRASASEVIDKMNQAMKLVKNRQMLQSVHSFMQSLGHFAKVVSSHGSVKTPLILAQRDTATLKELLANREIFSKMAPVLEKIKQLDLPANLVKTVTDRDYSRQVDQLCMDVDKIEADIKILKLDIKKREQALL